MGRIQAGSADSSGMSNAASGIGDADVGPDRARRVRETREAFRGMYLRLAGDLLAGKWILSSGLGARGGTQPDAATLEGASLLVVECRHERMERLLTAGRLDRICADLEDALDHIRAAPSKGEAVSVGIPGNAAELFPKLVARGERPDMVTDQTPADAPLAGYLPRGWTDSYWRAMQEKDPASLIRAAHESVARQVESMLVFHHLGVPTFELGNGIRRIAIAAGVAEALSLPVLERDD